MSKLGLILLRQKGMHLLYKVLERTRMIETITVRGIFGVKWTEGERFTKIQDVYPHIVDRQILEELVDLHGSEMIAIVMSDTNPDPLKMNCPQCGYRFTGDRLDNMHINRIKDDFRSIYGNVIHSADTEDTAINEMVSIGIGLNVVGKFRENGKVIVGSVGSSDDLIKRLREKVNG